MFAGAGTRTQNISHAMRCRYCVEERSFLPMTSDLNGGFLCKRCGHMEKPDVPDFPCTCRKCVRVFLFSHDHLPRTKFAR